MVTSQYIAITIAPLLFGWIADRIGKKPILLLFMLIFASACFFTALSNSALFFIIGVFLLAWDIVYVNVPVLQRFPIPSREKKIYT
jgi:MFS family permease